jgi:hypothetical protein
MPQNKYLPCNNSTRRKSRKKNSIVLSVRITPLESLVLNLYSQEFGYKSSSRLLKLWVKSTCLMQVALMKRTKGIELSQLESALLSHLDENLYPQIKDLTESLYNLHEGRIIPRLTEPLKLSQPYSPKLLPSPKTV